VTQLFCAVLWNGHVGHCEGKYLSCFAIKVTRLSCSSWSGHQEVRPQRRMQPTLKGLRIPSLSLCASQELVVQAPKCCVCASVAQTYPAFSQLAVQASRRIRTLYLSHLFRTTFSSPLPSSPDPSLSPTLITLHEKQSSRYCAGGLPSFYQHTRGAHIGVEHALRASKWICC